MSEPTPSIEQTPPMSSVKPLVPRLLWLSAATAGLCSLGACVAPDIAWQRTGYSGPIAPDGNAATVLEKCGGSVGLPVPDVRPCRQAFGWKSQKADFVDDVAPALDALISRVPEFASWRTWGEKKDAPYDIVLVAVEPPLLIAVPLQPPPRPQCKGYPGGLHRVPSKVLSAGYSFCVPLPAKAGSFWLGASGGRGDIPTTTSDFVIKSDGLELRLLREGDEWKPVRIH